MWLCVGNPAKASIDGHGATAKPIGSRRELEVTIGTSSRVLLSVKASREAVIASAPLSTAVAPARSRTS